MRRKEDFIEALGRGCTEGLDELKLKEGKEEYGTVGYVNQGYVNDSSMLMHKY